MYIHIAQLQSIVGLLAIPLMAWAMSEKRNALDPVTVMKIVVPSLALQFAIAAIFIFFPASAMVFKLIGDGVIAIQSATEDGLKLVFGYLAGGQPPFEVTNESAIYILAFRGLPTILLMSVLARLLYLSGILQLIIRSLAWALKRTTGDGGALAVAAAANIFVGMVEAVLLIRPYLEKMSRGALFAVMTVGMATVAGTVIALYVSLLAPTVPNIAGHILIASLISVPAALMIASLMVPERLQDDQNEDVEISMPGDHDKTIMGAIYQGTTEGLKLLAFVTAMLVVMVALVALINLLLSNLGGLFGWDLSFEKIVGWFCAPLAWIIGIPYEEVWQAGQLIGVKIVLNELFAFLQLAQTPVEALSERSRLILAYALCGFANFGSLGIMAGGLIALVPQRRHDIATLAPKTIISGTLATLLTGAVIALLTPIPPQS